MYDEHIERRKVPPISPELLEAIADMAAEKALNKVYEEVGKSVLKKLAWMVGVVVVGLFVWLGSRGFLE